FAKNKIAQVIGTHKSVVCRELKRNCNQRSGQYKHDLAQRKYETRLKKKPKKVCFTAQIKLEVEAWLSEKYSPEQIVGFFEKLGKPYVSAERIYQHIWLDKKNKGSLYLHLRHRGRRYRKRRHLKDSRGIIKDRVSIE